MKPDTCVFLFFRVLLFFHVAIFPMSLYNHGVYPLSSGLGGINMQFFGEVKDIVKDVCIDNEDGLAKSRRSILSATFLLTIASVVTGGSCFTVLMLAMGADDVYIGTVTTVTTFCSIVQIAAPLFWEKLRKRKKHILLQTVLYNILMYGATTLIPLFSWDVRTKLIVFMVLTAVTALLNNFTSPALEAWTMQSIPFSKRMNYTSLSSVLSSVLNVIALFLAGVAMDAAKTKPAGGGISPTLRVVLYIRAAVFLIEMLRAVSLANVTEFSYEKRAADEKTGLRMLLLPLKNSRFLRAILIPCVWTFLAGIIGSFFNLYLVDRVRMSYTLISAASLISAPLVMLLTPVWTLIMKKHSWVKTLAVGLLGYAAAYACNVFISSETLFFYFAAIILGNVFIPPITIANGNMIYLYMPGSERTVFFSFFTLASGISSFLGQMLGTVFVRLTGNLSFTLFGIPICNLQLVSAIAAVGVIGLTFYTYHYAEEVKKDGTANMWTDRK